MTSVDQVNFWINEPKEHQTLEFKEAKNQFDFQKLCEYCVAIANEGGGHLLLGVTDRPPRRIVGSNACRDTLKTTQDIFGQLHFRVDVEAITHPQGRVLVFSIPSRPRGSAYQLEGKYLMRSGEALVPMSEDRLRTIFNEGKPDWLDDSIGADYSSQEVIELLDTQTYFELREIPYPSQRSGVIDRLVQDRLVARRESNAISISRLGALLLAKRLDDFSGVARKAARVIVYSGISKTETKLEQVGAKGYAVGFQGLVDFVMSQLPQNEIIVGALRKEQKLISQVVIRELIANALVHQDFSITGSSAMIEVYSNRVEISNPGEPIVPVERFVDGYQSRNERLASVMRLLRICEEKGSGIDTVVSTIEHHQLPAPAFGRYHNRTFVTIYGHRRFEAMQRDDRIRACYQHACLRYVLAEAMTNKSLRERFGLAEPKSASVSQVIAATIEEGLIKPDETVGESRRLARYLPFWA